MRIETERLVLREFREQDWLDMAAYWADPRYAHFYEERDDPNQCVRDLVSRFVSAQSSNPRYGWQLAVTLKSDDQMVGNCGIRINNVDLGEANIGYELNPTFWGNGYATEAARAIIHFGFQDLGLHRIWAECVSDNVGSARVLEKVGMRQEAHFREHQYYRGRWWDTRIYAILSHEWQGSHG